MDSNTSSAPQDFALCYTVPITSIALLIANIAGYRQLFNALYSNIVTERAAVSSRAKDSPTRLFRPRIRRCRRSSNASGTVAKALNSIAPRGV